jgi:hypothetical protein
MADKKEIQHIGSIPCPTCGGAGAICHSHPSFPKPVMADKKAEFHTKKMMIVKRFTTGNTNTKQFVDELELLCAEYYKGEGRRLAIEEKLTSVPNIANKIKEQAVSAYKRELVERIKGLYVSYGEDQIVRKVIAEIEKGERPL